MQNAVFGLGMVSGVAKWFGLEEVQEAVAEAAATSLSYHVASTETCSLPAPQRLVLTKLRIRVPAD